MQGPERDPDPGEITQRLQAWRAGVPGAQDALLPQIYNELKQIAGGYMRRERAGHTLQPTALVNEAWMRLAGANHPDWENRRHFYCIAARLMRQVLVEHARRHLTAKRGQGLKPVPLTEAASYSMENAEQFVALNDALDALGRLDERKTQVVELRYFGGLSMEETAAELDISINTVNRDLRFAEAWLQNELNGRQRRAE